MINNTTLVGRLTKDLELRYTGGGIAVTNFVLAVERSFSNAQGEKETDFINCVIWREKAENLSKFAVKGSLIGVTGSIQTRDYENNQGQKIYVTEVLIDEFQMLEPKSVTDSRRSGESSATNQYQSTNEPINTWENTEKDENPFANIEFDNSENEDETNIDPDDLPF